MVTERVEDLPLRGGHAVLDFVNTVHDVRTGVGEHLPGPPDLALWARRAGVVGEVEHRAIAARIQAEPIRARAAYRRALGLRSAITRLLTGGEDRSDPALIDRWRRHLAARQALRRTDAGLGLHWTGRPDLDLVGARVVEAFIEFVASEDARLISQCAGPRCGWLYLDRSPTRRRRWCSMQDCGNRAKVRRFRARTGVKGS